MKPLKSVEPIEITKENFSDIKGSYRIIQKVFFRCEECGVYVEKVLKGYE